MNSIKSIRKLARNILLEELTRISRKQAKIIAAIEIERVVGKDFEKSIKKEVEKELKNSATKEEISKITKSIIVKLFRALSLQDKHVIEKIKP